MLSYSVVHENGSAALLLDLTHPLPADGLEELGEFAYDIGYHEPDDGFIFLSAQ